MAPVVRANADGVWPFALFLAALVAGAVLRFWGLDWDQGMMLHPDEGNLVRGAIVLDLRWGEDPDFYAYGGLSLFAPRLVTEIWTFFDPSLDPRAPHIVALAARWISAWCSLGVVAVGALTLRLATGRVWLAAGAAWLLALDVGLIQAAHFGTTDAPLVLVLAILAAAAAGLVTGRLSPAAWTLISGLAMGLGLALKASAAPMALVPVAAALIACRRFGWPGFAIAGLAGFALAVGVFALFNPHAFLFWEKFISIMDFESGVVSGRNDVFWTLQFVSKPSFFIAAQLPWMSGPLIPGLGLAGCLAWLVAALRGNTAARALAPLSVFALVWLAYASSLHAGFIRYLLPLSLPLALAAIWLIADLAGRRAGAVVTAVAAVSAIWALAFTAIYRTEDSRIAASRWLVSHAVASDVLLTEPSDSPMPVGVLEAPPYVKDELELRGDDGPGRVRGFAEKLRKGDWILMPTRRNWSVLPRLKQRFPAACAYYRALFSGALGYEEAARFPNMPRLFGIEISTRAAEETFEVFDHPTVIIYRKTRVMSADEMEAAIEARRGECAS